jgi:uncharacterized protein (TIRG00374 family)
MRLLSPRRSRTIALIVGAFVVVATVLVALKWKEVSQVLAQATWQYTALALASCLASDVCLSFGYVLVNRAFSIKMGSLELLEIGFVSSTLNNVMALAGAPAHSMRVMLTKQRGLDSGEIVAASLFHSFVSNVVILALFIVGLVSLLFGHVVLGGSPATVIFAVVMVVALFVLVTAIMVVRSLRKWVLRLVRTVWKWASHRDISSFMNDLDGALSRGLGGFKRHRLLLAGLVLVELADWALSAGGLWFCFAALGKGPSVNVLLAGFSIGISAGNLSMVPGGLGVQEASMAGVFALLGVPFAQAALAAILFRVANNFVPFFVSLPFYAHLVRRRC